MSCFGQCRTANHCKLISAIVFSFAIVVYGVSVCIWISNDIENDERRRKLNESKLRLACHVCFSYDITTAYDFHCDSIEQKCSLQGWKRNVSLPASCDDDEGVNDFVRKEVRRVYDSTRDDFETKDLNPIQLKYLEKAENSFYLPGRTIIHWSPKASITNTDPGEWQTVREYEHNESTYTISAGNENSYLSGLINITETGMYLVYARLTFACQKVDRPKKRIYMEVVVHESAKHHFVLLRDMQTATCDMKADLVTMYQSGMFRLAKNHTIELKYKAPSNVVLSHTRWLYKSSIGLVRLGLA